MYYLSYTGKNTYIQIKTQVNTTERVYDTIIMIISDVLLGRVERNCKNLNNSLSPSYSYLQ